MRAVFWSWLVGLPLIVVLGAWACGGAAAAREGCLSDLQPEGLALSEVEGAIQFLAPGVSPGKMSGRDPEPL